MRGWRQFSHGPQTTDGAATRRRRTTTTSTLATTTGAEKYHVAAALKVHVSVIRSSFLPFLPSLQLLSPLSSVLPWFLTGTGRHTQHGIPGGQGDVGNGRHNERGVVSDTVPETIRSTDPSGSTRAAPKKDAGLAIENHSWYQQQPPDSVVAGRTTSTRPCTIQDVVIVVG